MKEDRIVNLIIENSKKGLISDRVKKALTEIDLAIKSNPFISSKKIKNYGK